MLMSRSVVCCSAQQCNQDHSQHHKAVVLADPSEAIRKREFFKEPISASGGIVDQHIMLWRSGCPTPRDCGWGFGVGDSDLGDLSIP
jgi:hypothetical protein